MSAYYGASSAYVLNGFQFFPNKKVFIWFFQFVLFCSFCFFLYTCFLLYLPATRVTKPTASAALINAAAVQSTTAPVTLLVATVVNLLAP